MEAFLTVAQVSDRLGVTPIRVYQMDAELDPLITIRTKTAGKREMKTRHYRPEVVEAVRVARAAKRVSSDPIRAAAREVAARHLHGIANDAPFFVGVAPEDTDKVRMALRDIAEGL